MEAASLWDRWQVISVVPGDGWFALLGTDPKVDSVRLVGWALVEKVPPKDVLGIEFEPNKQRQRRLVGLIADGPKEQPFAIAEEIENFNRYIHRDEIDDWHNPAAV